MKKFLALLVTIGAGVGGFLWWKRHQVIVANEVSADPWPSAVAPVQTPTAESPAETAAPSTGSADTKPEPKMSTPKKKTAKKAAQAPE